MSTAPAPSATLVGPVTFDTPLKPIVLWAFAILNGANGLWMFFAPETWFFTVPGVIETGSFNPHLVRDVGIAYMSSAIAIAWAARSPHLAFVLMIVASLFLGGHAILHVWDIAAGRCGDPGDDIFGVIVPSLLTLGATWWVRPTNTT